MTTAQLEYLDELIASDEVAAAALEELDGLLAGVAELRERAEHVRRELELGPTEVERRRAELASAREKLETAQARLEQAIQAELAARETGESDRVRTCEQRVVEARDSVHICQAQAAEAEATLHARSAQLATAEAEGPQIEARAAGLAGALAHTPRLPAAVAAAPSGLVQLCEWAVEARAALVVARSAARAEREQAIRQAGELGALVTGEAVPASSMSTLAAVIRAAAAG